MSCISPTVFCWDFSWKLKYITGVSQRGVWVSFGHPVLNLDTLFYLSFTCKKKKCIASEQFGHPAFKFPSPLPFTESWLKPWQSAYSSLRVGLSFLYKFKRLLLIYGCHTFVNFNLLKGCVVMVKAGMWLYILWTLTQLLLVSVGSSGSTFSRHSPIPRS